ncbi:MAG: Crp/Fnr family transcriptional regulator, partial [Comamonadaceae bacterium]|nr:Crp/Fnr family transcriptional regulator [Comamonadaceae bacterium]
NEALATLEAHGALKVEYGGLRVLDLQALREGLFTSIKRAPAASVA